MPLFCHESVAATAGIFTNVVLAFGYLVTDYILLRTELFALSIWPNLSIDYD